MFLLNKGILARFSKNQWQKFKGNVKSQQYIAVVLETFEYNRGIVIYQQVFSKYGKR